MRRGPALTGAARPDRQSVSTPNSILSVYILGAGGQARDVYHLIQRLASRGESITCGGFVDLEPESGELVVGGSSTPVHAEREFLAERSHATVALGTASPVLNARLMARYSAFDFATLIDPDVDRHDSITFGEGAVVTAGAQLSLDVTIGAGSIVNRGVIVGHETQVGDHCVLNPGSNLSGRVVLGARNLVGAGATVLQELRIGSENTIGAGSVVTKDIDDGETVVGVPARPVEART